MTSITLLLSLSALVLAVPQVTTPEMSALAGPVSAEVPGIAGALAGADVPGASDIAGASGLAGASVVSGVPDVTGASDLLPTTDVSGTLIPELATPAALNLTGLNATQAIPSLSQIRSIAAIATPLASAARPLTALSRPSPTVPSIARPSVARPSVARPLVARPSVAQASILPANVQPSVVQTYRTVSVPTLFAAANAEACPAATPVMSTITTVLTVMNYEDRNCPPFTTKLDRPDPKINCKFDITQCGVPACTRTAHYSQDCVTDSCCTSRQTITSYARCHMRCPQGCMTIWAADPASCHTPAALLSPARATPVRNNFGML